MSTAEQAVWAHVAAVVLGSNAHETLMTKDLLGQTRWQEGRYTNAKTLHQEAVDGLIRLKGIDNEDTLTATGNLGRTKAKFYENLDEAKSLLKRASHGMSKVLGTTHVKTLIVQEDLALLAAQMEEELCEPLETVQQVLDIRTKKLPGRLNESIQYCDEAIKGLQKINATQHPLERELRAQKEEMVAMREQEG
ncbi:hypothetical protein AN8997.2 [Aspergillus nidulans FGSC A4]|uniref:Uncharacterized protein n=1 Tax=Emericella nidulans (strain FGSC A4 / ATCC 38163 / CBS 112.46 / NRRL 194 / M139) TaxID=227321 RepID=Q5ART3_EMENI|nr:hypothetical protein [Aspergillus nidulans FGSC A4]EAA64329.1 hypothetical protein AN8997.2 [Aspergillus nidulans FGSC A4]CBF84493.1 TPA: conserved hypothetical protein [Aspergillus nidulans FGSC A4]|eukprot:XP_682266.1 hypothetical protein AN8997.2 [Aspergillus nidulans FGSC A4]